MLTEVVRGALCAKATPLMVLTTAILLVGVWRGISITLLVYLI